MASKGDIDKFEIQPNLPERWASIPFKQGLKKTGTFTKLKSNEYLIEGLYPVIDQGEKFISGFINDQNLIYKGDFPVVIFGDHTRVIKYVDFEFAAGADGTKILKSFDEVDDRFFYYYLRTLQIPSFGYSRHYKVFEFLDLPIPPLPEQKRIVAKLDAIFGHLDTLKTKLDNIPELLKNFRQQVLTQAVTGKLTEEWREGKGLGEWEEGILDSVGKVTGGLTLNSKRKNLEIQKPYLRVANVYANKLLLDEIKLIGATNKEIERTQLKKGDLLIVEGNGSPTQIGRVAQWNEEIEECLHQNHLIKFRANNLSDAKYVLFFLLSPIGRSQIENISKSTSGLYTLSISKISNLIINIPTLEEQQEVVAQVKELFALADKIESQYQSLKTKIDKLPQAILNKAFKGDLVSQDSNDEPESELLKRIQKEKAKKGK